MRDILGGNLCRGSYAKTPWQFEPHNGYGSEDGDGEQWP